MHVPPIDRYNNGRHREAPQSRGSMTQFLKHRVLRFKPSRLDPVPHPECPTLMIPGPSIAPVIRQNKGKRPLKQHAECMRKNSEYRRNRAEVGRMLNEVREDGKL